MKAKIFDKKFDDNNEDIINDLDLSTLSRPNQKQKRVNVDFPVWIIESLDKEANRIGVTRQSIIKLWLAERLEESVPKLSGQLSSLAGEKNALAKYLTSYRAGTDKRAFEHGYREKVQQLNQKLREIQRTIDEMDPKWKGNNPMANFNASSAVAQKQLFLQEYGMPEDLFEVNLTELANAYNNEAYNLLQASIEISNSLKEHNNGVEQNASR